MPIFHETLVQLRKNLGYKTKLETDEGGLCVLYAEEANDAFLSSGNLRAFKARCEYIKKNYSEFPTLFNKAKQQIKMKDKKGGRLDHPLSAKELQMVFDVVAFMEQGELYQNPFNYSDIFNRLLHQMTEVQDIAYFAQSSALEALGGKLCLASFYGIYTNKELEQYIHLLASLAERTTNDFAININVLNGPHRISICYSNKEKIWQINDANYYDLNKYKNIVIPLSKTFNEYYEGKYAIQTQIFTTGQVQAAMQPIVDEFLEPMLKFQQPSVERVKYRTEFGKTLGSLAVTMGDVATLNKIIRIESANLNSSDGDGVTAIWRAAQKGHAEILKLLVDAKMPDGEPRVDLNKANKYGVTPVVIATVCDVLDNRAEVVRILVDAKFPDGQPRVDLNKSDKDGNTSVQVAAENNYLDILSMLVDAKMLDGQPRVDLNQADIDGQTSVFLAAENNHSDILRILVDTKMPDGRPRVDLNQAKKDGKTPVWIATQNGKADALKVLVDAKTPEGQPRVDLNQADEDGITPIWIAAHSGHTDVLKILINAKFAEGQYRIDLSKTNAKDSSLLSAAACNNYVAAMQVLVDAKTPDGQPRMDVNQGNNDEAPPLWLAAMHGNIEIVKILIAAGANPECNYDDLTALEVAALEGFDEIVGLLDGNSNHGIYPGFK